MAWKTSAWHRAIADRPRANASRRSSFLRHAWFHCGIFMRGKGNLHALCASFSGA
jgi:hypothetical protein